MAVTVVDVLEAIHVADGHYARERGWLLQTARQRRLVQQSGQTVRVETQSRFPPHAVHFSAKFAYAAGVAPAPHRHGRDGRRQEGEFERRIEYQPSSMRCAPPPENENSGDQPHRESGGEEAESRYSQPPP